MTDTALLSAAITRVVSLFKDAGWTYSELDHEALGFHPADPLRIARWGEHDLDVHKKVIQLANDLENVAERWALLKEETMSFEASANNPYLYRGPMFRAIRKRVKVLTSECPVEFTGEYSESVTASQEIPKDEGASKDLFKRFTRKTCILLEPCFQIMKKSFMVLNRKPLELPLVTEEQLVPAVTSSAELEIPDIDGIIGFEEDIDVLREKSLQRGYHRTIAITGVSGVGKTALAHKLCSVLKTNFLGYACVSLSHLHDSSSDISKISIYTGIFRSILEQITENERGDLSQLECWELVEEIFSLISEGSYLLFLDDVWSTKLWDGSSFIPEGLPPLVIIMTTRFESVAKLATIQHELRSWGDQESEELFLKKSEVLVSHYRLGLPRNRDQEMGIPYMKKSPEELEAKSRRDLYKNASFRSTMKTILSLCGGLPLEIIRLANILKNEKVEDWHKIVLTKETKEPILLTSITSSYEHLEPKLKACFLYLGLFPLDQLIRMEKVVLMWMAEGLVDNKVIGERWFKEFVGMKLVLVKSVDMRGVALSWQLQDTTRELCILKGKAEGFFGIVDSKCAGIVRSVEGRAAVYLNGLTERFYISPYIHTGMKKHIRALLFFGDDASLVSQWSGDFAELENFKSTRVLDFDGIDFRAKKLLIGTAKLVHLRYLSFERCHLEEFPLSFCNFPYLETLNLRVITKIIIPEDLSQMPNLKHLYFPVAYECKTQEKLHLTGLEKLEELENLNVDICEVGHFWNLKFINILTVICDGESNELRDLIAYLPPRTKTTLYLKDFVCYSEDRKDILEELLKCTRIWTLNIEGRIKRMPKDLKIARNFRKIVFDGTAFSEDPMPTLGRIENLESLVLCNDAISVEKISSCCLSFPELKTLEINNLRSLKSWVLVYDSMPKLKDLTIKQCPNLATLPDRLLDIPTLSQLDIKLMHKEFKKKVEDMALKQRITENNANRRIKDANDKKRRHHNHF